MRDLRWSVKAKKRHDYPQTAWPSKYAPSRKLPGFKKFLLGCRLASAGGLFGLGLRCRRPNQVSVNADCSLGDMFAG